MSQQAKKEQVIKLRDKGLSFGEISKELGISRSTVSCICQVLSRLNHDTNVYEVFSEINRKNNFLMAILSVNKT